MSVTTPKPHEMATYGEDFAQRMVRIFQRNSVAPESMAVAREIMRGGYVGELEALACVWIADKFSNGASWYIHDLLYYSRISPEEGIVDRVREAEKRVLDRLEWKIPHRTQIHSIRYHLEHTSPEPLSEYDACLCTLVYLDVYHWFKPATWATWIRDAVRQVSCAPMMHLLFYMVARTPLHVLAMETFWKKIMVRRVEYVDILFEHTCVQQSKRRRHL